MPDDLDPARPIEARVRPARRAGLDALSGPSPAGRVGRFRLDLRDGRWEWSGDVVLHPAELLADRHPDDVPETSVITGALGADRPFGTGFRLLAPEERPVVVVGDGERAADGTLVALTGYVAEIEGIVEHWQSGLRERAGQFERALRSRPVIEQAKGMLMLRHGCGDERAFELLVAASQASNRKLRDVAALLVDALPAGGALPPDLEAALQAEAGRTHRERVAD
ncbi:MAG: ANTAR domain-containing protein [Pseudonocardia sp.]|nr:ANTAR domain-containing protein [Pseudonocardia sp.]